ncbi:MAG: trigger factor [Lachnospiraceae bacterium]|nr:trigger factor [Lachnospiraceae bacterium]
MSLTVEKLEKNMAKLTITVSAETFTKAMTQAYHKQKNKISVPGFRKGKVPQAYLEKVYGPELFYEDAANICIQEAYPEALEECDLDIVSRPEIDAEQMEKGKDFIFTAMVATKPEVTLGEYKGIAVDKVDVEVTDAEIEEELKKAQMQNRRSLDITDRPAELGDTVVIDFDGYMDGKPFEGGKGDNYPLELGSHSFIGDFEEQLVGKKIDEDVEVNVTFPEDYQAADLAGKPAVFKVKIHSIKANELPELNDEFASEISEFDTLDEYKADVKEKLLKDKQKEADRAKENAVVDAIIENSQMDIPEPMIDNTKEQMYNEFAQRISYQGLSIQQYFQFTGLDHDRFMESMAPEAKHRIQSRLVLEAIVKAENIEVSEEEQKEELDKMANMYQMDAEKLSEMIGEQEKEAIMMDIAVQKAVDFVVKEAIEK